MPGLVVIVMRTKDRPLLLRRALRSVLSQTRADWHLVVVNDGGDPDPVDALAARHAKAFVGRLTVIHNPASVGMEAASNIGLRAVDGTYAIIHDDDDSWDPAFLEATVAYLEARPAAWGGVVTHTRRVMERITGQRVVETGQESFNAAALTDVTLAAMASGNLFPPISFLFRKAVLDEIGYFREDLPVLGDWEFNIRFLERYEIGVVPRELAYWHHRESSASASYQSSTLGQSPLHAEYDARLRNERLRQDVSAGRLGVGMLMNQTKTEAARLRHDLAQTAEALRQAERRELLSQQHIGNINAQVAAGQATAEGLRQQLEVERTQRAAEHQAVADERARAEAERELTKLHIANLQQVNEALSKEVGDRLGEIVALEQSSRAQAEHFEQRLASLDAHLQASRADTAHLQVRIAELYRSTSWRVAAPVRILGRLAARLRVGNPLRWRRWTLQPQPHHDVAPVEDGFVATGPDPQMILACPRGRLPRGLVLVQTEGQGPHGEDLTPALYLGDGSVFRPDPVPLTSDTCVRVLAPSAVLRLDPREGEGAFRLGPVRITEVSPLTLALYRAVAALRLFVGERRLFRRRAARLLAGRRDSLALLKRAVSDPASLDLPYDVWVRRYDSLTDADRAQIRSHLAGFAYRPRISVLMPVYNPPLRWLKRAIWSVQQQLYPDWELCIADDKSSDPAVREFLQAAADADPRIKIVLRATNGHISAASNSALKLAGGDFVALLDNDDELPEHALYFVALELQAHPDADILYSDEDKIDEEGIRFDPYFKSDWNPDLLLSQNCVSHLGVFRRSLVEAIGGFRVGFEGSQDLDLVLRLSENTAPARIRHIPRVLYHWRSIPGSTARAGSEKSYAWTAGQRAVEEALQRRGVTAEVGEAAGGAYYRVRYPLTDKPRVSLFIPTRDRVDLLRGCITTILGKTDYPDIEIIVIDNGSVEPATLAYFDELRSEPRVRVVRDDGPFNFSRLNNVAAEAATGAVFGLVNNDIEVFDGDWLREMVSHALRPEIGAVGAMLYYGNNHIQHAGVITGMGGVAGHIHRMLPRGTPGYFGRGAVIQNLSAVTAACLVMRRDVFEEVGGLDAENLPVAFNDIDLCLRIGERGYRVLWTPHAELYHLESATRGSDDTAERRPHFAAEIRYMLRRWPDQIRRDPYFNPNLSLLHSNPTLAFPPAVGRPWRVAGAPAAGDTGSRRENV